MRGQMFRWWSQPIHLTQMLWFAPSTHRKSTKRTSLRFRSFPWTEQSSLSLNSLEGSLWNWVALRIYLSGETVQRHSKFFYWNYLTCFFKVWPILGMLTWLIFPRKDIWRIWELLSTIRNEYAIHSSSI